MDHRFDGLLHEARRVIDDPVVDAVRKVLLDLLHRLAHVVRQRDGVRLRRLEDGDRHRRLVVEQAAQCVLAGAQLDASDVLQMQHAAVGRGGDDDVAEFLFGHQPALRIHRQLKVGVLRCRRCAHHARRDLLVLLADRARHIARGEVARRELLRIEPDAHRVIAGAEYEHLPHAGNALQRVLDVKYGVVAQVQLVIAAVGRDDMHDHRQVR